MTVRLLEPQNPILSCNVQDSSFSLSLSLSPSHSLNFSLSLFFVYLYLCLSSRPRLFASLSLCILACQIPTELFFLQFFLTYPFLYIFPLRPILSTVLPLVLSCSFHRLSPSLPFSH